MSECRKRKSRVNVVEHRPSRYSRMMRDRAELVKGVRQHGHIEPLTCSMLQVANKTMKTRVGVRCEHGEAEETTGGEAGDRCACACVRVRVCVCVCVSMIACTLSRFSLHPFSLFLAPTHLQCARNSNKPFFMKNVSTAEKDASAVEENGVQADGAL